MRVAQLQWLIPKSSGGIAVSDVHDIAASHLAAAKQGQIGERYLLCTENYSNEEWFGLIAKVAGVAPPTLPTIDALVPLAAKTINVLRKIGINTPINADQVRLGSRYVYYDASKAHRELHQPQIPMPQSVQETYDWYREQGFIPDTLGSNLLKKVGNLWHN